MLDIIIPVYDEAENIESCLREIASKVTVPIRVTVVYDFKEDNTIPVVEKLSPILPFEVKLAHNDLGRGPVNAIKKGFEMAKGEAVLVTMADLSDDMAIVDLMYRHIEDGADVVCGSRYMRGGRQIGGPLIKKLMSRTAGLTLHWLAGIPTKDATNNFKMYSKRARDGIDIKSNRGFEIGLEMVVKAHKYGMRIVEIPSVWRDRVGGDSKFRLLQWLPAYLRWYWFALTRGKVEGRGKISGHKDSSLS